MNLIQITNNKPTTTSLQVAEFFNKNHKNVLRDIRNLIEKDRDLEANFELSDYTGNNSSLPRNYEMYLMDKDGFTLLAMGFTGKKAMEFKKAYIKAFNQMEAKLIKPQASYEIQDPIKRAEAWIAEQKAVKPALEFHEQVTNSNNAISIGAFAKLLPNVGELRLFTWLRDNNYLMSGGENHNLPYQQYIEAGYFKVIEQTYKRKSGSYVNFKTLVTGKGQVYFAKKFNNLCTTH